MKQITLQEAYNILQDCSAVIISDHVLVYPSLDELTGDKDNEFMYIGWSDEGLDYAVKFKEEFNSKVTVSGSSMFLVDEEGDDIQLTILEPKTL